MKSEDDILIITYILLEILKKMTFDNGLILIYWKTLKRKINYVKILGVLKITINTLYYDTSESQTFLKYAENCQ